MRRFGARVAAETIFVFHTALMALLLFGWLLIGPFYDIYVAALAATLGTQFVFRNCILTTWEFHFRRKLDPELGPAPYYLTYYSHKFFPDLVTDTFVDRISLVFLSVSLVIVALRLSGHIGAI